MSRILPRYIDTRLEDERAIARALLESGDPAPQLDGQADPGDLRGIPVIARGVGGTSPGSDPYRETERRLTLDVRLTG